MGLVILFIAQALWSASLPHRWEAEAGHTTTGLPQDGAGWVVMVMNPLIRAHVFMFMFACCCCWHFIAFQVHAMTTTGTCVETIETIVETIETIDTPILYPIYVHVLGTVYGSLWCQLLFLLFQHKFL